MEEGAHGYTNRLDDAGVYFKGEAVDVVLDALPMGIEVAMPILRVGRQPLYRMVWKDGGEQLIPLPVG